MGHLSQSDWKEFYDSQVGAHDDYMTHPITWLKSDRSRDRWGEDKSGLNPTKIELLALLNYNYMRTWPITQETETGSIDRQSTQAMFSKPMLKKLGYLNENGNFDYDPQADRFIIHGRLYKATGDTDASQVTYEDDLLFTVILRPEITATGSSLR